jgi:hypothetical protein
MDIKVYLFVSQSQVFVCVIEVVFFKGDCVVFFVCVGYVGVNQSSCEAKSCCWQTSSTNGVVS